VQTFERATGTAALLPAANIDTDTIMPKQFLKGIDRSGLADGLFHDLRFMADGVASPDFILNAPGMTAVSFLVTGANFGCGSSREHAVWGLLQFGVRAIVGTTFGSIFADNAANNGLLVIPLDPAQWAEVADYVGAGRGELTIDLARQRIEGDGLKFDFAVEPEVRRMLMLGLDRIGETLSFADRIREFEVGYFDESPWLGQDGQP
jgi:3-isopropylmalate/(R)-2-methylmalate dehydratase small subunit